MKNKLILVITILIIIAAGIGIYFSLQKGEGQAETFSDERYSQEPTGFDLIQQDLDEEKIDYETALIYKIKYLFGDNTLPKEYITEATPFEDDGTLTEIQESWDQLSEEAKNTLLPYFKRPDDPESFLNQAYTANWGQEKTGFLNLIDIAQAHDRPTAYKSENALTTADGKIKVWYPIKKVTQNGEEKEIKLYYGTAQKVVANLNKDKAYSKFNTLLKKEPPSDGTMGGDSKTDVYLAAGTYVHLAESGGTSSLGVNVPDNGTGDSSFIVIRENLDDKNLRTTTVHELFHAFQRAFACTMAKSNLWWIEGTAVWSEDYIYPKDDTEQGWVSNFIPKPEVTLTKQDGEHEYGAYVFPFFLSDKYGDSIIEKVFSGCSSQSSPLEAVENNIDGGFKKNWKEFTLSNYNKKPVPLYKNMDESKKFPSDSSEAGGNSDMIMLGGLGDMPVSIKELTKLTSQVIKISLLDDEGEIRKVVFKDLKKFTSKSDKAGLKAIIYPVGNKEPYIEDWTEKDRRAFCFDKDKDHFEKIILITSNAELKNKIAASEIKIRTNKSCYEIDQKEVMIAKPIFALTAGYVGKVIYSADGSMEKSTVKDEAPYAYLGKWKIEVKYAETWPPQGMGGITSSVLDFSYDHVLEFDLSADSVLTDGTFAIQTEAGDFKTPGWDIYNEISGDTVNIPSNTTGWDLSNQQTGVISDMTENGAKISIPEFVLYNSGGYRDLPHPIVLEIKKD